MPPGVVATDSSTDDTASGGGTTDHRVPSQCSTNWWVVSPRPVRPTAQTSDGPVTATSVRIASTPGLGDGTIVHADPFQRSTSVCIPVRVTDHPTAPTSF